MKRSPPLCKDCSHEEQGQMFRGMPITKNEKNARIRNVGAADNLTWAAFIHKYSFNLENLPWCCRVSCCTIHV